MLLSTLLLAAVVGTTSALPSTEPELVRRQNDTTPFCSGKQGLYSPTNNEVIVQNTDNLGCNSFLVLYCSPQYGYTSSVATSAWLSYPGESTGEVLVNNRTPDNLDAPAGFYSYRYNVTLCPEDGGYMNGNRTFSIYETSTGYYNPTNYEITSINIHLETIGEFAD